MKKIILFISFGLSLFLLSGYTQAAWPFNSNNGFVQKKEFNEGKFKGFNIGEIKEYDERYIDEIVPTGANILRVIVPFNFCTPVGDKMPCIYEVNKDNVEKLKKMSKQFGDHKIKIIVSAFFYEKEKGDFWKSKMLQSGMSDAWKRFADQIKEDKNIAALEIYYSPDASGLPNKHKVSKAWSIAGYNIIKSIRNVDQNHIIIFQVPEGDPKNIDGLLDLNDNNIVYGFDMFYPSAVTLQGIINKNNYPYPLGAEYGLDPLFTGRPSIIDKKALSDYLQPIIDFKNKGNTVFISSWGMVYYAPEGSTYRYLSDVLSIFNNEKLSWAYYGFRINKSFDPFIIGENISDEARSPEASLISLLRDNMKK